MELDQVGATFGAVLRARAENQPQAVAMVLDDRVTDYATFDRHASQVANGLIGIGAGRGQRVAWLGKNSDLYFELLLGAARAGVVTIPLNWRLAPAEIATILADADIAALFVGPGFGPMVPLLGLPDGVPCVSIDGAAPALPDFIVWRDGQSAEAPASLAGPDDTVLMMYTSGTTGVAKGVELSHANMATMLASGSQRGALAVGPEDRMMVCMPVSHVAGTDSGLVGLSNGATVIVMAEFDPPRLVELIPRHRITWMMLVPAAIRLLVQHPAAAQADFGTLRTLVYGASPIAEALIEQARAACPNAGLWQAYGLTEVSGGGTLLDPASHDPALGKLRSCGKPYPGFALRIVDLDGAEVPGGTVGEIVLRAGAVMKGYWRNPAATGAAFFPGGWLRTGDAGWMDGDGYVYIHDRVKDMIVSGGENVYPAEVENALYGHPAIADVAVIGVPDAKWGETVKALVVLKPGAEADEAEIVAYARARIAGFKVPRSVEFIEALPRNAAGKILRRTLREPYWQGHQRRVG